MTRSPQPSGDKEDWFKKDGPFKRPTYSDGPFELKSQSDKEDIKETTKAVSSETVDPQVMYIAARKYSKTNGVSEEKACSILTNDPQLFAEWTKK